MSLANALLAELKHEAGSTKKMLEAVPFEKFDFKPHEKSMTLGRLATHVAEIPHWATDMINAPEFDFAAKPFVSYTAVSKDELMKIFEDKFQEAVSAFENCDDELLNSNWTMRRGDHIIFTMPRKVAIRSWAYNHLYHHRGQLSVYLRLLNVPVPGMYGPTADDAR